MSAEPRGPELVKAAEKFLRARQLEASLYMCELALKEEPGKPEALAIRGRCLASLGRFPEAVSAFESALAASPADAALHAALGQALDDDGRARPALRHLDRALELDGGLDAALLARGSVKQRLGDFEGSLADLDAYLKRRPRSADALVLRGCCLLAANRKDDAKRDFARAMELEPRQKERVARLTAGLL